MKNKGYAKFRGVGANKVYYGRCANGDRFSLIKKSARNNSRNPNSFSVKLPVGNENWTILMLISYDIYPYKQIGNY